MKPWQPFFPEYSGGEKVPIPIQHIFCAGRDKLAEKRKNFNFQYRISSNSSEEIFFCLPKSKRRRQVASFDSTADWQVPSLDKLIIEFTNSPR